MPDSPNDQQTLAAQLERLGKMRRSGAIPETDFVLFKAKVIESATAAPTTEIVDQLERLDKLRAEGSLEPTEFAASKRKVLPPDSQRDGVTTFAKPRFGYITKTLIPGESIVAASNISLIAYLFQLSFGMLFLVFGLQLGNAPGPANVILLAASVFLILPPIVRWFTNQLVLTDRRLIAKVGIVAIDVVEMKLDKIESVNVNQGFVGRLLRFGKISVVGTGGSTQSFPPIDAPTKYKLTIDTAIERLKHQAQRAARNG